MAIKPWPKGWIRILSWINMSDRNILAGIGELIDAKQKAWIKSNLKKDAVFLLKARFEQEK